MQAIIFQSDEIVPKPGGLRLFGIAGWIHSWYRGSVKNASMTVNPGASVV